MSIQANINQGLSLMGLLASQSPFAETRREEARTKHQIKQAEKNVSLAQEAETEALEKYTAAADKLGEKPGMTEAEKDVAVYSMPEHQVWTEAMAAETRAHEQLARLNPTAKNVGGLVSRRGALLDEEDEEKRAREALEKENKRLARSREITKMITEGITYSPTSEKYIEKRLGGVR